MTYRQIFGIVWILGLMLTDIAVSPAWAGDSDAFSSDSLADSTAVHLDDLVVSVKAASIPATENTTLLAAQTITRRDPGSLADLGALLPSTRVAVNSRGESTLTVRSAPERHVQTFLDGIPLNVPWDERVDLETIPISGVGRVEGRRGLPSLLDGPGALAGSVRILPPTLDGKERKSQLSGVMGADGFGRVNLSHQQRTGPWHLLGAGGWQGRGSLPLAGTSGQRFNSDLSQFSLLLRASRPVADTGRLNFLATGWSGHKGVPPENHLDDEARFWRYPVHRRALLGASIALPLGDGNWDLSAMLAGDLFHQEIDPRGPDRWGQPLARGEDYEKDFDRTGHFSAGLTRWVGQTGSFSLQTNLRYTNHRESLVAGGGVLGYGQFLSSFVLEGEQTVGRNWYLRAGAGLDHAATPEAGDKPRTDGFSAEALNLRLSRELNSRTEIYAGASRRSRFPSLRELYSGALGKFVPNPDLKPERQDLLETGFRTRGSSWHLTGSAFLQYLRDGIEKESLPNSGGQFRRANRTEIRVPGLELSGSWQVTGSLDVFAQHTVLAARVETPTGFDRPAEDRPDYFSALGVNWQGISGPGVLLETAVTGSRWSADATDANDGLAHLPAAVTWNARLGWRWSLNRGEGLVPRELEAHLRVNNLFDQAASFQVGLPEPGRVVSVGLSAGW